MSNHAANDIQQYSFVRNTANQESDRRTTDYASNLEKVERSFPNSWHYDPDCYEQELESIWYRSWIYACRSEDVANPRDFKLFSIGDQSIIITRDGDGVLQAFHNTCRHRGSALCTQQEGRFKNKLITCPYHAWAYSLQGDLLATPRRIETSDFDKKDYALHRVAIAEWMGFVFINIAGEGAEPIEASLGEYNEIYKNYQMDELRVGFSYVVDMEANWKLWFENYNECYHCPSVHPQLSKLLPVAGKFAVSDINQIVGELPDTEEFEFSSGLGMASGGETFSLDGKPVAPYLKGLTEEERRTPLQAVGLRPSFFLHAHPDYVHSSRLIPTGPQSCQLILEYLFEPSTLERKDFDPQAAAEFWQVTNLQDVQNCEWQQSGLMSGRRVQDRSVFVSQEIGPFGFNQWVVKKLQAAGYALDENIV